MTIINKAAEVLAEHFELASIPDEGSECECGDHIAGPEEYPADRWRKHQADALAAAGLLATPEHDSAVWDEGSLAGWHDRTRSIMSAFREDSEPDCTPNPYREEQS